MTATLGRSQFVRLHDGRKLHYMVAGAGGPTVVFESGLGASRSEWGLVQPLVASRFRTVVYDRANLGRSDDDAEPRTLERLTGDMTQLLAALDAGPYILAGHSYGGTIALAAAAANPDQVVGLVLIDHADEHVNICCGSPLKRLRHIVIAGRSVIGMLRRLHLLSVAVRWVMPGMPADVVQDLVNEDLSLRAARAADDEERFFIEGLRSLRRHPPAVDDTPVTVISGMKSTIFDRSIRKAFVAAHRRTAVRLNARHVEAVRSNHQVVLTEPQLVAEEIRRIAGHRRGLTVPQPVRR
ncbi:alpha/beta hydrolase [Mycolicibacterium sp. GF69]|uniref:alpha/beta fold hydrolase n=1 Tax=Mycolicibacterium sp. GF69 TaxID=2267251 RepID=UPI000DCD2238|nr:alpha/beta hydrolase [Mycolicibacterium sp. GF69]MBY0288861.1 alpha/beta hydrolase [Mycobacteriaceae bacterium]RAV07380.1 alpha/beta hydrolase [Mycolicibacterium sp. GF69]